MLNREIVNLLLLLFPILFACQKNKNQEIQTFAFEQVQKAPVLDVSPDHLRMTSCYQDKAGIYHLFADRVPDSLNTVHSWAAEIDYFRSTDLVRWEYVSRVVRKGEFNHQNPDASDADSYGAASPGVLWADGRIFLFYAGRKSDVPPDNGNPLVCAGEPGHIGSRIMLAVAHADMNGAPVSAFKKHGVVVDLGDSWDSCRLDDPCAVVEGDSIHLFFKGFNERQLDSIRLGHAVAGLDDLKFRKSAKPVFGVSGGGEMPRVFWLNEKLHLFYRYFRHDITPNSGMVWKHLLISDDMEFSMINANLFNCVTLGKGASDMAPIVTKNGLLAEPAVALATGLENEKLKIWAYKMEPQSIKDKISQ